MKVATAVLLHLLFLGFSVASVGAPSLSFAQHANLNSEKVPAPLREIGVDEKLGGYVSTQDLFFTDDQGQKVNLQTYLSKGKPVLLALMYYSCPNLCNFMLNGLTEAMQKMDWEPGKEFELVTISIDPKETQDVASKKKDSYLKMYGKPQTREGWHFLTGTQASIQKIADEVGFRYKYDEIEKQYAHGAVLYAVTPEGRLSRYLYGIEFKPQNLKLALLEASHGKIGTVIDRLILFCFRYDPIRRGYSLVLSRVMQIGGALTVLILGGYLGTFWIRQRKMA